jgi:hypothetical protein
MFAEKSSLSPFRFMSNRQAETSTSEALGLPRRGCESAPNQRARNEPAHQPVAVNTIKNGKVEAFAYGAARTPFSCRLKLYPCQGRSRSGGVCGVLVRPIKGHPGGRDFGPDMRREN